MRALIGDHDDELRFGLLALVLLAAASGCPGSRVGNGGDADAPQPTDSRPDRVGEGIADASREADGNHSRELPDSDQGPEVGPDCGEEQESDWTNHGAPGSPCESADDCNMGQCVFWWEGKACSPAPLCMDECPDGWNCRTYQDGPDFVFDCVLNVLTLCLPCTTHAQCQGEGQPYSVKARCMDYGAAGSFCANECEDDDECPEGYACETWPDIDGKGYKGCRRKEGECDCSYYAAATGTATACMVENENGACPGERHCAALHVLTECLGESPAAETCDGKDDDCDGDIDEDCPCVPDCAGKQCGDNGCGGTCGECAPGLECKELTDDSGVHQEVCKPPCLPNCFDKECGGDGCGGACPGICAPGYVCDEDPNDGDGLLFKCEPCVPDCSGKECGDDGCGGSCGTCPEWQACTGGECG